MDSKISIYKDSKWSFRFRVLEIIICIACLAIGIVLIFKPVQSFVNLAIICAAVLMTVVTIYDLFGYILRYPYHHNGTWLLYCTTGMVAFFTVGGIIILQLLLVTAELIVFVSVALALVVVAAIIFLLDMIFILRKLETSSGKSALSSYSSSPRRRSLKKSKVCPDSNQECTGDYVECRKTKSKLDKEDGVCKKEICAKHSKSKDASCNVSKCTARKTKKSNVCPECNYDCKEKKTGSAKVIQVKPAKVAYSSVEETGSDTDTKPQKAKPRTGVPQTSPTASPRKPGKPPQTTKEPFQPQPRLNLNSNYFEKMHQERNLYDVGQYDRMQYDNYQYERELLYGGESYGCFKECRAPCAMPLDPRCPYCEYTLLTAQRPMYQKPINYEQYVYLEKEPPQIEDDYYIDSPKLSNQDEEIVSLKSIRTESYSKTNGNINSKQNVYYGPSCGLPDCVAKYNINPGIKCGPNVCGPQTGLQSVNLQTSEKCFEICGPKIKSRKDLDCSVDAKYCPNLHESRSAFTDNKIPKPERSYIEQPKPERSYIEQPKPERSYTEQPKPERSYKEQPRPERSKVERPIMQNTHRSRLYVPKQTDTDSCGLSNCPAKKKYDRFSVSPQTNSDSCEAPDCPTKSNKNKQSFLSPQTSKWRKRSEDNSPKSSGDEPLSKKELEKKEKAEKADKEKAEKADKEKAEKADKEKAEKAEKEKMGKTKGKEDKSKNKKGQDDCPCDTTACSVKCMSQIEELKQEIKALKKKTIYQAPGVNDVQTQSQIMSQQNKKKQKPLPAKSVPSTESNKSGRGTPPKGKTAKTAGKGTKPKTPVKRKRTTPGSSREKLYNDDHDASTTSDISNEKSLIPPNVKEVLPTNKKLLGYPRRYGFIAHKRKSQQIMQDSDKEIECSPKSSKGKLKKDKETQRGSEMYLKVCLHKPNIPEVKEGSSQQLDSKTLKSLLTKKATMEKQKVTPESACACKEVFDKMLLSSVRQDFNEKQLQMQCQHRKQSEDEKSESDRISLDSQKSSKKNLKSKTKYKDQMTNKTSDKSVRQKSISEKKSEEDTDSIISIKKSKIKPPPSYKPGMKKQVKQRTRPITPKRSSIQAKESWDDDFNEDYLPKSTVESNQNLHKKITEEKSKPKIMQDKSKAKITAEKSKPKITAEKSKPKITAEKSKAKITGEKSKSKIIEDKSKEKPKHKPIEEKSKHKIMEDKSKHKIKEDKSKHKITDKKSKEKIKTSREKLQESCSEKCIIDSCYSQCLIEEKYQQKDDYKKGLRDQNVNVDNLPSPKRSTKSPSEIKIEEKSDKQAYMLLQEALELSAKKSSISSIEKFKIKSDTDTNTKKPRTPPKTPPDSQKYKKKDESTGDLTKPNLSQKALTKRPETPKSKTKGKVNIAKKKKRRRLRADGTFSEETIAVEDYDSSDSDNSNLDEEQADLDNAGRLRPEKSSSFESEPRRTENSKTSKELMTLQTLKPQSRSPSPEGQLVPQRSLCECTSSSSVISPTIVLLKGIRETISEIERIFVHKKSIESTPRPCDYIAHHMKAIENQPYSGGDFPGRHERIYKRLLEISTEKETYFSDPATSSINNEELLEDVIEDTQKNIEEAAETVNLLQQMMECFQNPPCFEERPDEEKEDECICLPTKTSQESKSKEHPEKRNTPPKKKSETSIKEKEYSKPNQETQDNQQISRNINIAIVELKIDKDLCACIETTDEITIGNSNRLPSCYVRKSPFRSSPTEKESYSPQQENIEKIPDKNDNIREPTDNQPPSSNDFDTSSQSSQKHLIAKESSYDAELSSQSSQHQSSKNENVTTSTTTRHKISDDQGSLQEIKSKKSPQEKSEESLPQKPSISKGKRARHPTKTTQSRPGTPTSSSTPSYSPQKRPPQHRSRSSQELEAEGSKSKIPLDYDTSWTEIGSNEQLFKRSETDNKRSDNQESDFHQDTEYESTTALSNTKPSTSTSKKSRPLEIIEETKESKTGAFKRNKSAPPGRRPERTFSQLKHSINKGSLGDLMVDPSKSYHLSKSKEKTTANTEEALTSDSSTQFRHHADDFEGYYPKRLVSPQRQETYITKRDVQLQATDCSNMPRGSASKYYPRHLSFEPCASNFPRYCRISTELLTAIDSELPVTEPLSAEDVDTACTYKQAVPCRSGHSKMPNLNECTCCGLAPISDNLCVHCARKILESQRSRLEPLPPMPDYISPAVLQARMSPPMSPPSVCFKSPFPPSSAHGTLRCSQRTPLQTPRLSCGLSCSNSPNQTPRMQPMSPSSKLMSDALLKAQPYIGYPKRNGLDYDSNEDLPAIIRTPLSKNCPVLSCSPPCSAQKENQLLSLSQKREQSVSAKSEPTRKTLCFCDGNDEFTNFKITYCKNHATREQYTSMPTSATKKQEKEREREKKRKIEQEKRRSRNQSSDSPDRYATKPVDKKPKKKDSQK